MNSSSAGSSIFQDMEDRLTYKKELFQTFDKIKEETISITGVVDWKDFNPAKGNRYR